MLNRYFWDFTDCLLTVHIVKYIREKGFYRIINCLCCLPGGSNHPGGSLCQTVSVDHFKIGIDGTGIVSIA